MKKSSRIISSILAFIIVASTMIIGGISASAASLKAPQSFTAQNTNIAIQVSWKKVAGAKTYQIYRNNSLLTTVSTISFKDINVHGGTAYSYKVRAVNGSKKSSFSATRKVMRINSTIINTIENVAAGVKLTWAGRTGASRYLVERKASGAYSALGYTTSLSYIDKNAVSGTAYTYRVTCCHTATNAKSVESTALSIVRLVAPTGVKAVKAVDSSSVTISWAAAKGATSYYVYRQKITDDDFKKIATISGTKFTDYDIIENPSAYRYYVAAAKSSSKSVNSVERFVYTFGYSPATFDSERNYHIPLKFKVGDVYADGKALSDYFSYDGNYDVTITEGSDVISITDSVITAKKAGTATVTIKVTDEVKNIVDTVLKDSLVSLLTNKNVVLDIVVS